MSNGTGGNSRRNGWRHSRSRISGRNPRRRSLMAANPDGRPPLFMVCGSHVWGRSVGHLEGRQLGHSAAANISPLQASHELR